MANSSKKIVRGVRVGRKTYAAGTEDELAKVLEPKDAERLVGKGYLEGSWGNRQTVTSSGLDEPRASADAGDLDDLNELTVLELKDLAKDAGIQGVSTMNKADLVNALSAAKE